MAIQLRPEEFDPIALQVWDRLRKLIPAEFHEPLSKVRILIQDEPDPDLLSQLDDDLREHPDELFGLHVGIPITQESLTWPSLEPVRVYLFRRAHLELASEEPDFDLEDLREEIAVTLLHEIGHYFGLDEDDLERLGFD